jgi:hypothetical protein
VIYIIVGSEATLTDLVNEYRATGLDRATAVAPLPGIQPRIANEIGFHHKHCLFIEKSTDPWWREIRARRVIACTPSPRRGRGYRIGAIEFWAARMKDGPA